MPQAVVKRAGKEAAITFEALTPRGRNKVSKQATSVNTFRDERNRWESTSTHAERVQSPQEHNSDVKPGPGQKENSAPSETRGPKFVPPREVHVAQAERVQVPVPPVGGKSGVSAVLRKGPPSHPKDEDKDRNGKDIHKEKGDKKHR